MNPQPRLRRAAPFIALMIVAGVASATQPYNLPIPYIALLLLFVVAWGISKATGPDA